MKLNCVRELASLAACAPSVNNCQPWELRWNGDELRVGFSRRLNMHSVLDARSHANLLSVGALMANLQNGLAANSVQYDWRWPRDPAAGNPYVTLAIDDAPDRFVLPEGPLCRHTNRFAFRDDAFDPAVVNETSDDPYTGARAVLLSSRSDKSALVELVRLSSEARFCNRQLHEWLIGNLRFTPDQVERGDGLDVDTLGLTPGGRKILRLISDWRRLSAFNKIGAYKLLALSEIGLLAKAPGIVCIVGKAGTCSVIDAGQLMTQLWTQLNAIGIAVHPYYVVTDQINRMHEGTVAKGFELQIADVEARMHSLLNLEPAECVHMIFRVGYPTVVPERSRRLPLQALLSDETQFH
jgi:hypothetical protein